MQADNWRVWEWEEDSELTLIRRAKGEFPEMECTKQLVKLVSGIYEPGMTLLDVGCGPGHYLRGLHRLDPQIAYYGVDATRKFIEAARQIYKDVPNARFEVGDVFDLQLPEHSFDIVTCNNVILHLPDFQAPIRNLLRVCKQYCFIRTLVSDRSYIVKLVHGDDFDEHGNPLRFIYQNTYSKKVLRSFIEARGSFDVHFIEDEFDPQPINREFTEIKKGRGTRCVAGMQLEGNIVSEWWFLKITRRAKNDEKGKH